MEGFIDIYGMPVLHTPKVELMGVDRESIYQSSIDYWNGEVESLTDDADTLNEVERQVPRTEAHACRDESKAAIGNGRKM